MKKSTTLYVLLLSSLSFALTAHPFGIDEGKTSCWGWLGLRPKKPSARPLAPVTREVYPARPFKELRAEIHNFLNGMKGPEEIDPPEVIEAKDQNVRESIRYAMSDYGGTDDANFLLLLQSNRLRMQDPSDRREDGLPPPQGHIFRGRETVAKIADGNNRSCFILYDENVIRFGDDAHSGVHLQASKGRPVTVAAEMAFKWVENGPERKLVLQINPQSGSYNWPYIGPKNEYFNSFATLERLIEAIWLSGVFPDEIEVYAYGSKKLLKTFNGRVIDPA